MNFKYNTILTGRSYEYQYCKEKVLDHKKGPLLRIFRWPEKIATTPDVAISFKVGDVQCASQGNQLI